MSNEATGKMGLPSLTLFSVCAVLVVDGLTASASIGPSSIVWWQILICIGLTWLTIWICNISVDAGVWVTNLGG
ncbi:MULTISPECIES: hypothetical protein [unclassified Endozoicomonas]|uniref:hypothetical protein n=1 Tax=unclassified Endozoicomonas TaxID=2644528 RepID=UPI003BB7A9BD